MYYTYVEMKKNQSIKVQLKIQQFHIYLKMMNTRTKEVQKKIFFKLMLITETRELFTESCIKVLQSMVLFSNISV